MLCLQVQGAVQLKYSHLSSSESLLQWTEQLTTYYLQSSRYVGYYMSILETHAANTLLLSAPHDIAYEGEMLKIFMPRVFVCIHILSACFSIVKKRATTVLILPLRTIAVV